MSPNKIFKGNCCVCISDTSRLVLDGDVVRKITFHSQDPLDFLQVALPFSVEGGGAKELFSLGTKAGYVRVQRAT